MLNMNLCLVTMGDSRTPESAEAEMEWLETYFFLINCGKAYFDLKIRQWSQSVGK